MGNLRGRRWLSSARRWVPAVLGVWLLVAVSGIDVSPMAYAYASPELSILTPAPADSQAEGPVSTNVTIQAQGFTPGDTVQLGYAQKDVGCSAGFTDLFSPSLTVRAGGDGSFTTTFVWPVTVNSVGTAYFICAQDTTTPAPSLQSGQTFLVDSAEPPVIIVTPGPGPGNGTPTTSPQPTPAGFVPGGQVSIEGHNYLPIGRTLLALLLKSTARAPKDFATPVATVLTLADQTTTTFVSGDQGDFTVTVRLPQNVVPGRYFLYVVTSDGTGSTLPSLTSQPRQITVSKPKPTPTVTITPARTPLSRGGGNRSTGQPLSTRRIVGILGLGGMSVLLFVLGVIFLASAAALPRQVR